MNTKISRQIWGFHRRHVIKSPMGHGITDGVTICSCGAKWHTWYSKTGLEWNPLDDKCQSHDRAESKLPKCPACNSTLTIDMEQNVFCPNPECGWEE